MFVSQLHVDAANSPTPKVYLVLGQTFLSNLAPGKNLRFDLVVRIKEEPGPDRYLSDGHDEVDAPIVASYVNGNVGHNLPVSLANCSGVNSRSMFPRPALMARSTACLHGVGRIHHEGSFIQDKAA